MSCRSPAETCSIYAPVSSMGVRLTLPLSPTAAYKARKHSLSVQGQEGEGGGPGREGAGVEQCREVLSTRCPIVRVSLLFLHAITVVKLLFWGSLERGRKAKDYSAIFLSAFCIEVSPFSFGC